jgi:hypothetical protein
MTRLTRERELSILNTFAKHREFKKTGKIEGVDWRSVRRIVRAHDKGDNAVEHAAANEFQELRARLDEVNAISHKMMQSVEFLKSALTEDQKILRMVQMNLENIKRNVGRPSPRQMPSFDIGKGIFQVSTARKGTSSQLLPI